jgi:hypothetical protein
MGTRRLSVGQVIVAGCLVVALVFGVTYAKVLMGPAQTPKIDTKGNPTLLGFQETAWPVDPNNADAATVTEWHVEGHHNFWFDNTTPSPVQVYLRDKTCKCTKVELVVLPEDLKDKPADERDRRAATEANLGWHVLDRDDNKGLTVPAHSAGGVRLTWKAERLGKERLAATLWNESGALNGDPITLAVNLDLVPAMQVCAEDDLKEATPEKEVPVGTLAAGDAQTVNLLAWSATRSEFSLKVKPPDEPCIQCGAPQRLSKEDCERLAKSGSKPVRCAYRVPVTVREHTEDGKQFDLGRFRKFIQFTSDPGIDPTSVAVGGMVRGDITVGTADDHDMVILGSFKEDEGKSKQLPVTTTEGKLELELAEAPEFLKVDLKEQENAGQLGKTWLLTVTVPPKGLTGEIPRHTRIVLKTKGERPRRLSIPVTGNAYVP